MSEAGFIRLYRKELTVRLKNLTDRELRLFLVFATLAGWDHRNKRTYGIVRKSYREIKAENLSKWSIGKISEVSRKLIGRGFIERIKPAHIRVNYYWLFRANIDKAEQGYQLVEQGIQPTEQNIREYEQGRNENLKAEKENIVKNMRIQ